VLVPESSNVEIAHKLSEGGERHLKAEVFEIIEVLVLAIVAIATAWSGYQAAKWDGRQSVLYGTASSDRFEADAAAAFGGQQLTADSAGFTAWLQASAVGDSHLQTIMVRRFTPDYRAAFEDWVQTNPLTNNAAPPGPVYMPSFHNPSLDQAKKLNAKAADTFEAGTSAGETGDVYVRNTVLLASVLFLIAIAQRLKIRAVRLGGSAIGLALLAFTLISLVRLPRL
jgi:hypothetical protein